MNHTTEFCDRHGNPYIWTKSEIAYLLSQLLHLADAGLEFDGNGLYADDIAAKGIKIALIAWEAKIDTMRIHDIKHIMGAVCIDCLNAITANNINDGMINDISLSLSASHDRLCDCSSD